MKTPSASRLDLAEACPVSQVIPGVIDITPHTYRERGTALHNYLRDVAMLGAVDALQRVPEEFKPDALAIDLDSLPHSTPDAWAVEVAYAYDVGADTGRELHRGGSRDYSMVAEDEVPGTADVVGVSVDEVVVLDVKTGRAPLESPEEALQLLFLALAAARAYGKSAATVGWIRLIDGVPRFSYAKLTMLDLDVRVRERIEAIISAVRLARLQWETAPEVVQPVIGPHCKRCDSFFRCPAQASLAVQVTKAALATEHAPLEVPDDRRADFYRWVEAIEVLHDKLATHLEAMARAKAIDLGDGRVLGPKQEVKEFLNATITQTVLREVAPAIVDDVVTEKHELVATKDALTKAVKKHLPVGKTQKGWVTELLRAIRTRGGTYAQEYTVVKVFRPKALPEKADDGPTPPAEVHEFPKQESQP